MRVKLNTIMCGPAGNFAAGQEADFDETQARALICGGYAEAVIVRPAAAVLTVPETAMLAAPETAAMARPTKRGKRIHAA